MAQDIRGHGFAHEIRGTEFHGLHGELDGGKGRHHDHARRWSTLPETTERFNAIDTRHLLVQQHDVPDGVSATHLQASQTVCSFADLIASGFQGEAHHVPNMRFIINHQYTLH